MKTSHKVVGITIASTALAVITVNSVLAQTAKSAPEQRVSIHFVNAPLDKVLDYLAKTDSNFVISSQSLPKDARLTLSIKNRPLPEVEKAIAVALGGHWEHVGNTLTFAPGQNWDSFKFDPNSRAFDFGTKDLFKDGKMPPQFEDSFKSLRDQFGPDFQNDIKGSFGPDFEKRFKDAFGPEFQERMKKLKKELDENPNDAKKQAEIEKEFGPDFQKKIEGAFGPDFEKRMEEFGQKMSKDFGDSKSWQNFKGLTPDQQKMLDEHLKGLNDLKKFNFDSKPFVLRGANQDLPGLAKSLTPEQKDKMARNGYLTPGDLTPKQRQMLGHLEGKYEIEVSVDGQSVKVKSE